MATNSEDTPALPDGYEADRLEQALPAVPGDEGRNGTAAGPETLLAEGSDADRHEQALPADPAGGSTPPSGDEVLPGGSEADRLEQTQGIAGTDDEEYPHGTGEDDADGGSYDHDYGHDYERHGGEDET